MLLKLILNVLLIPINILLLPFKLILKVLVMPKVSLWITA